MDYAFTKSEYAILLEDDVIVSKNFLRFFEFFINNNYICIESKNLCIAGESIFFDAQYRDVSDKHIKIASDLIHNYNLQSYYLPLTFVPSSCFCTSDTIWEIIGTIRGQPTGCNKLNDYVKNNGYFTISPVVPVCKDIGMMDSMGYSTVLRSKNATNAPYEYKNVYILNEFNNKTYTLLPLNKDKLYDIVSNLNIDNIALM
jgi:GR25 family glycosyltransferase involved in LPS biosynthesis